MSRLWPILFSVIFFFGACTCGPDIETLDENQLLLSYQDLKVVYNKDQGGWIGQIQFKEQNVFLSCQDQFPSLERSYRNSPTSIVHDNESVFARTFHDNPKLSVNRSFLLKDNTLELNWKMKNSGDENLEGAFELKIELASPARLKTQGLSTLLILKNGIQVEIQNDRAQKFSLNNTLLTISDPVAQTIKPLHRSSQKISFKFSN